MFRFSVICLDGKNFLNYVYAYDLAEAQRIVDRRHPGCRVEVSDATIQISDAARVVYRNLENR